MRAAIAATMLTLAATSSPAVAQIEYSANDVFRAFYSVISEAVKVNDEQFLSMSIIGAVAEPGDLNAVNQMANACPPVEREIASVNSLVHLDAVYDKALEGMIGPDRPKSQKYLDAVAFVNRPEIKAAYSSGQEAYIAAASKFIQETDAKKRPELLSRLLAARDDWKLYGYKGEVDAAKLTIDTEGGAYSEARIQDRRDVLVAYRAVGMGDTQLVAFRAPTSEVTPPVDKWNEPNGWVKISFSDNQFSKYISTTTSSKSGFGGLSLGFVTVGGTSGGNKTNENRVSTVKNFSFTVELKRVGIVRNWLDTRIFTEPGAWTWKRKPNTPAFPYVSYGKDDDGTPYAAPATVYDNSPVFCPMIPLEMIIARNLSIVSTMSKSDYNLVTTSGSSGGGGGFAFIAGGSRRSWTTQTINESGNDVTFQVDAPGTAVVGFISGIVPVLPVPNQNDDWPEQAWSTPDAP